MSKETKEIIYLDYAATTPVDPRVVEAMMPYFWEQFGNAASRTHAYGWEAEEAVKRGREQVAELIGAKPEEIVFTSGATEALNLAIKGVFEAYADKGNHIITVQTEHKAVLDTCKYLETKGAAVTYLPVEESGLIRLEELEQAITERTVLVCVMLANNETGVIQPIEEIARIAHQRGVLFLSDATQAVGKIPVDVQTYGLDLMAFSAHKLYGPKGIGALYIKRQFPKIKLTPVIHGGGHERGFRSGTLNTSAIVGFGKACALASQELEEEGRTLTALRRELEERLQKIEGGKIHAQYAKRLPHIINMSIEGVDGEAMIMAVRDRIAVANGSACTSAEVFPSHVLMAMYGDEDVAYSSIRISLGRFIQNVENVYEVIGEGVMRIRQAF
jgi:cysteine desulfurase